MARTSLKEKLTKRSGFVVLAELTGGPGFSFDPIEKFLRAYKENPAAVPAGFDFAAVTLPQSPGGVANIEPAGVIAAFQGKGLLDGLEVVPHVTCKDMNADAIVSSLMSLRTMGVESVLALTGDKPVKAAGVFELESLNLLRLIQKINHDAILAAKPQSLGQVRRFFAGAAVSPFKYTEPSQMQQYYKMEKKIACGAEFLITQVGWDWKKSLELFRYLKEVFPPQEGSIPVIGNVYLLSTLTPAPRLMHDGKLPGCFVSDELLAKVQSERVDDHIERAAQQVAMYKGLGAAGVDVGGVPNFEIFVKILNRAAQIGAGWEQFKGNLCWPTKDPFYLYDESGQRVPLITPYPTFGKRFFDFAHWAMLDPKHVGFRAFKKTMSVLGADAGEGAIYKLFNSTEKGFKYLMFDCEECGDCFLPENFGLCTMGGCEKGLDNAPCGDATADGHCGNNLDRVCTGERIYEAAASEDGGKTAAMPSAEKGRSGLYSSTKSRSSISLKNGSDETLDARPEVEGEKPLREVSHPQSRPDLPFSTEGPGRQRLRTTINKPRNPALRHSSSIINYLFGKDRKSVV